MAASHILLADDDTDLRVLVTKLLERAGYRVTAVEDGAEALRKLYGEQPDLVILDVDMPRKDGWQTLEQVREMCDVPVMMLTASVTEMEKVRGLKSGADDYVTKPFGRQELVARVEALLRRGGPGGADGEGRTADPVIDDGLVKIDFQRAEVLVSGQEVQLTPLELKILAALVRHPGQVLSREQIRDIVWQDELGGSPDQVKVYVGYVRRKLAEAGAEPIATVRGFGYRYSP